MKKSFEMKNSSKNISSQKTDDEVNKIISKYCKGD